MYRYDPEHLNIVIQEGGSSTEIYADLADSAEQAEQMAQEIGEHSYRCLGIHAVGRSELEKAAPYLYTAGKAALQLLRSLCGRDRTSQIVIRELKQAL